jgi:hypothetical protein
MGAAARASAVVDLEAEAREALRVAIDKRAAAASALKAAEKGLAAADEKFLAKGAELRKLKPEADDGSALVDALLCHNAKSGLCFPSYATIAEAAGCAVSTVAEAITSRSRWRASP